MQPRIAHLLCLITLVAAPAGGAESPMAATPLTLRQALERTLRSSPALEAERLQLDAMGARMDNAALAPPLTLHGELENFGGTDAARGAEVLEATLRLSAVLELGGRRGRRQAVGHADRDVAAALLEARQLEVLGAAAEHFIEAVAAASVLEVQREDVRLAKASVAAVERRISLGAAPRFELAKAAIRLEQAKLREEHAEHEFDARRRALAANWGERTADFSDLRADLFALPGVARFDELARQLGDHPRLRMLGAEERASVARLRLAEAGQRPDLTVSAGVRRLEALDDTALIAAVSVPLGTRARAQPSIREAMALQRRAQVLQDAQRLALETTLYGLTLELAHARLEVQTLRGPIGEHAAEVVAQVERGFRDGRFSFEELGVAHGELIDSRRSAIDAAARFHRLLLQIEQLTGASAGGEDIHP